MDNTKHNLYTESLSSKINRLEQTIRELTTMIEQKNNRINILEDENINLNEEIEDITSGRITEWEIKQLNK